MVLETRRYQDAVYRKRCCPNCSKSVITIETVVPGTKLPREPREDKQTKEKIDEGPKVISLDVLKVWR
jgi:transcriptional regulator NrdR family protein